MKRTSLVAAALLGSLLLPPAVASAGGGSKDTFPTPIAVDGPCDLDITDTSNEIIDKDDRWEWDVDMFHPEIPDSGFSVHVVTMKATKTAYVESYCAEDGWTLSNYKPSGSWSKTGGFDITFAYQGQDALKYRHVLGGLRWWYYPVAPAA